MGDKRLYPDETNDWRLEVRKAKERGVTDEKELKRIYNRVVARAYYPKLKKREQEKREQTAYQRVHGTPPAPATFVPAPSVVPLQAKEQVADNSTDPSEPPKPKPEPRKLSPKQQQIIDACRERCGHRKYIFVNGPKWTGKSRGCCAAVVDYLWNVKNATVCVLAASIGAGDDCGIWTELMRTLQEDIDLDYGMVWWNEPGKREVFGPKIKAGSKKIYAEVRNKFGGKSYLELNSLRDERDVEKIFFNRYFSMIYWSELQNSKSQKTFVTLCQSLRLLGSVAEDDHILLADGNPSDLGKRSWQYKLWFELRTADDISEEQKPLQRNLKLIQIFLEDQPFLTAEQKNEIAAGYAYNPDLYARYVKGDWVDAVEGGMFTDVFLPKIHLVGDPKDNDPEILLPTDNCTELVGGFDPGGMNSVAFIIEPTITIEDGRVTRSFQYIDELAYIDEDIPPAEFGMQFLQKMKVWERHIGHPIVWRFWSDSSALDTKESMSQRTVADEIFAATNGEIRLEGVEKGHGSIAQRAYLWRRLLIQRRILISATKCPRLVESCQMCQHGKQRWTFPQHSPFKHAFDAATYPLMKELWDELQTSVWAVRAKKRSEMEAESSLVMIHH